MAGVSSCMKYSMFIFNFLFWVCGSIILGISIWLRVSKSAQANFNIDSSMSSAMDVLIAVGAIIMVLGFLGCCGAMKESQCMLLLFFIGLLAILLLQIVAGVLGAVYKSQIEEKLQESLSDNVKALQGSSVSDRDFQAAFRKFEIASKCCGLGNGRSDWGTNADGCKCATEDVGTSVCTNNMYNKSCEEVLINLMKNNMIIVMGVAFGLVFIEVLGLVFSMSLYCQIQRK